MHIDSLSNERTSGNGAVARSGVMSVASVAPCLSANVAMKIISDPESYGALRRPTKRWVIVLGAVAIVALIALSNL